MLQAVEKVSFSPGPSGAVQNHSKFGFIDTLKHPNGCFQAFEKGKFRSIISIFMLYAGPDAARSARAASVSLREN